MPSSKSTSGPSSSSDSVEEKPSVTLDHSETSTEAEQAPAKARAYAGMFTFPCPRHYCQDLADRQACKVLKPSDVSKEQLMEDFRKALKIKGYLHNLIKMGVADEPHKHYHADARERHKHLIFLFRTPMVHAGVRQMLAERFGYHGFFTFHRTGWAAYLDYLMVESSKNQLTIWTVRCCSTPRAIPGRRLKLNLHRCPLKLQADGRMTKSKGASKRNQQANAAST